MGRLGSDIPEKSLQILQILGAADPRLRISFGAIKPELRSHVVLKRGITQ